MIILGTNSIKDTGYNVANSLRFNDGSSDFLSKTFGSAGNQQKMTISFWIKRSDLSGTKEVISQGSGSACHMNFQSSGTLEMNLRNSVDGGSNVFLITNRLFRDVSAWYHIVLALDTTQGTASNRAKLYVNGVQETSFGTENYPSQNGNLFFNEASAMQIGEDTGGANFNYDGYMAEFVFINAEQLAPTSFGEFDEDSGIWKPKNVSGLTFGTNGFYLEFKESGTSQNSSGLGADTSGQDNHFAVNNLTAVDQSTDTCTNNFCTMNSLATGSNITLSEGNLVTTGNTASDSGLSTITIPFAFSGKWYWEAKIVDGNLNSNSGYPIYGIFDDWESVADADLNGASGGALAMDVSLRFGAGAGQTLIKPGTDLSITAPADDDIIMFAIDKDNGKFYMGNNGTWYNSGDPTTGATGTGSLMDLTANKITMFGIHEYNGSDSSVNFGSPAFAISSGNTDAEGFGNFEFAVPSGYFALCTKNLAEYG